jgi:hypothetical protein
MSHQDLNVVASRLQGECLKVALQSLLSGVNWSQIKFRQDCSWTPKLLAATALLWVWSDELTLVERFSVVRSIVIFLFALQHQVAESYQAFIKILLRWTDEMVLAIQVSLRERMSQQFPDCWELFGFIPFGGDGSRIELPRTKSHEQAYSAIRKSKKQKRKSTRQKARNQKHSRKSNSPQMWLTTLWHIGTGLPWNWRRGPADSSERAHLLEMLNSLPALALIVADAGFVGYDFARAIMGSGRQLLIRVGSNIKLLRQLGCVRESGNTVYLWPDTAAKKNCPPLVLRLVVVHNGKHPVYLVTSVCSAKRLSDSQIVELYRRRWGIELFYRHLKQTFQRRKLRSTSADNAGLELEWSLVGLWAMGFYALLEARRANVLPGELSVAKMLRAFRRTMKDYRHPAECGWRLRRVLREATIDSYARQNKTSRNYPRKKKETPPGRPVINIATPQQIALAKDLMTLKRKGLTA